MVEHIAGLMALRMANGDLIPYNLNRYASDLKMHISNAETKISLYNNDFDGFSNITSKAIQSLEQDIRKANSKN